MARRPRDFTGQAPLPATPTTAPPLSDAKIDVMARRALRGECLFHPHDAPLDDTLAIAVETREHAGGGTTSFRRLALVANVAGELAQVAPKRRQRPEALKRAA